jgi:hypothetical protein
MTIHIWCPRVSDSAIAVRNMIRDNGTPCHKTFADQTNRQLQRFLRRVKRGDLWINWGAPYLMEDCDVAGRITTLNRTAFLNKKSQLLKLREKGVPTLEVSDGPREGYIGRSANHQGGHDLITNTGRDYYTKKVEFTREVRVHIYKGRSIHSGLKVAGPNAHPWIRSYDTGWRIVYSHAKDIAQSRRELAKSAIKALGLDFGAVDIGIIKGDKALVLEVNTAPGIEGETLRAYVNQFLAERG